MNKKDLVNLIGKKMENKVNLKVINEVVTEFMSSVLESVSKGESIKLVGFMNILLKPYGERKVRNPKTGETSMTKPSVKASAKLGALFKEATSKLDKKDLKISA